MVRYLKEENRILRVRRGCSCTERASLAWQKPLQSGSSSARATT